MQLLTNNIPMCLFVKVAKVFKVIFFLVLFETLQKLFFSLKKSSSAMHEWK